MPIPTELTLTADLAQKSGPQNITARELLQWYGFSRRGANKVARIRKDLRKLGVKTDPDFDSVWVDVPIVLQSAKEEKPESGKAKPKDVPAIDENVAPKAQPAEVAPSHRISRLKAANTKPISVKPNDKVETAASDMADLTGGMALDNRSNKPRLASIAFKFR
jgi:hypothetical protein